MWQGLCWRVIGRGQLLTTESRLDLSDETILGVGQMRTTADIMCYSGVVCACEKGENLGSSPVLSRKTNCAWDKSM